jgi:hypothetical protein
MLARYADGASVVGDDAADLAALLVRHPEAQKKIGAGVLEFYVAPAEGMGTRCFHLRRTDGSSTDFSYLSCVSGRAKTVKQEFLEACREAVHDDILTLKKAHFAANADDSGKVRCDETGALLTWDEAHVDHSAPMRFEVICEFFLVSLNVDAPDPAWLSEPADHQYKTTFTDERILAAFRRHHDRAKRLRWVSKQVNLSLASRGALRFAKNTVGER